MNEKTNNTSPVVAGVAGAVVGAGVAVAATRLMSDKKMRDKVKGTLNHVKDQVIDVLDQSATVAKKGGQAIREAKKSLNSKTPKQIDSKKQSSGSKTTETPGHSM